jgi:uncharacterized protein
VNDSAELAIATARVLDGVPARLTDLVRRPGAISPLATSHMVSMRDQTMLATDVYLPAAGAAALPTILVRLPYDKAGTYAFIPQLAEELTKHGYAVVAQDVRGKFRSDGDTAPGVAEVADGYDTLEWISAQPWSDGKVGMLGDSYYGYTQWAAAASGHPALRAIVPRFASQEGPCRWFKDESVVRSVGLDWLVDIYSLRTILLSESQLDWTHRPYTDLIPADLPNAQRLFEMFRDHADDLESLYALIYPDGLPAPRLQVPALHIGGWWDVAKSWQLADWAVASTQSPAAVQQHLIMAAVDHQDLRYDLSGTASNNMFASAEALAEYLPMMLVAPLEFFDTYLRGDARSIPKVRYEVANDTWRTAECWPPKPDRVLELYLDRAANALSGADGGLLNDVVPTYSGIAAWTHEPADPVPDLSSNDWEILADLPDETVVHGRADVATFTGAVVTDPFDIVGNVTLTVAVTTDAPSAHLVATLIDVTPAGRGNLVVEGVTSMRGTSDSRHVTIDLGATAYRVLPGHRLRLALCCSRFPRYLPDSGSGQPIWTGTETRPSNQQLRTGPARSSSLCIPIVIDHPDRSQAFADESR